MIIEVNTKLLHMPEQINVNQLFFLSVVLDKNQKSNQDVRKIVSLISDDEIQYLVDQNLISSTNEGDKIIYLPTEKLTEFLKPSKTYFELFSEIYPKYVLRPDGTKAYLKTNINRCHHLFNLYTGLSEAMAQHLIDCLNFEVSKKTRTGKIGYMKTMYKWLIEHQWEESEAEMQDETKSEASTYGTELI
jgi:hypothetical protein